MAIRDRYRLPGVVDEQLVARRVLPTQHRVLRGQPAPILVAEHAVLPAVRLRCLVLLPQQQPGHPGARQLGVEMGKIRCWPRGSGRLTPVQLRVQRVFGQLLGQRPAEARRFNPGADTSEPSTAHCRSRRRSRGRSSLRPSAAIPLESCARATSLAPLSLPFFGKKESRVARLARVTPRPACSGLSDRHGPESVTGMLPN